MSLLGSSPGTRPGRFGARLVPRTGDFLSWWGRSLASWLPRGWRRLLGIGRGRLLLQVDGDTVHLRLQQEGELRDLAVIPLVGGLAIDDPAAAPVSTDPLASLLDARLSELPRWLLLAPAHSLRRRISLPAAAGDRLRDVVGFEIDRQTPFTAGDVAFDARVLARRDNDGQLDAELVAVPRQVLEPQLERVGRIAPTLAGVDVAAADGMPLGVNLLPAARRSRTRDPWMRWNLVLATVALAGVGACMWQLLDNRRAAAERFEQEIATQARAGRQASAQRQELATLIAGQAFLDNARAQRPAATEVIDELTRRIPDGTYLEKISLDDRQLMLIGLSGEAAGLIGRLQGAELWRSPALAGALQPDPSSGRDRFTLTASLAPVPAAAKPGPEVDNDDPGA